MKISELNEDQKSELVHRLDHNTHIGLITACRIAKGEFGDDELEQVFIKADKSPRSAKILAKKVIGFSIDPDIKFANKEGLSIATRVMKEVWDMHESPKRQIMLFREVAKFINSICKNYENLTNACERG
jgi:hypothetical protein